MYVTTWKAVNICDKIWMKYFYNDYDFTENFQLTSTWLGLKLNP